MARKKRLRVLALTHEEMVPPESLEGITAQEFIWFKAVYDVIEGVEKLGHEVWPIGVQDDLQPIRAALQENRPHVVFNLLEGFRGLPYLDQNVVSYLELNRQAYTGCNPRGLILARDKALSKKILHYHRIRSPEFMVFPMSRSVRPSKNLPYPMIVKPLANDASTGISQASVVHSPDKLIERVKYMHEHIQLDVIVEEYIEGRELYVALLGNYTLKAMPIWELRFDNLPPRTARIATEKVKWDIDYQDRHDITTAKALDLDEGVARELVRVSKKIYRLLGLSGYARLDFRLSEANEAYFLEANPNPDISRDEEFASAAIDGGIAYEELLQKILNLGLRRREK